MEGHRTPGRFARFEGILQRVKFVDLVDNPLASVGRRDFYNKLESSELEKLVWIPSNWVDGMGWTVMIDDKGKHEMIKLAHTRYYAMQHKAQQNKAQEEQEKEEEKE